MEEEDTGEVEMRKEKKKWCNYILVKLKIYLVKIIR